MSHPTSDRRLGRLAGLLLIAVAWALPAAAQTEEAGAEAGVPSLPWQRGPGVAPIGDDLAEIELGADWVFLDQEGTRALLEAAGNPVGGNELATVAPISDDESWFVIFEWDDIGYVKDDEGGSLDADGILASIREGTKHANEERERRGWSTIRIVGWREEPHYDASSHDLTWAIIGESDGQRTVNRMVKLLGRHGVMTATLVSSEEELDGAMPRVDGVLEGYRFRPGSTYAEFVPGSDRLAEVGLTALIAGGAGVALVKSGLLARLWKLIVAGGAAVVAGVGRLFSRRKLSATDPGTTT